MVSVPVGQRLRTAATGQLSPPIVPVVATVCRCHHATSVTGPRRTPVTLFPITSLSLSLSPSHAETNTEVSVLARARLHTPASTTSILEWGLQKRVCARTTRCAPLCSVRCLALCVALLCARVALLCAQPQASEPHACVQIFPPSSCSEMASELSQSPHNGTTPGDGPSVGFEVYSVSRRVV